jgi:hypothetical protein
MKRDRLEHEIELIENDDSLTPQERAKEIHELEKDYTLAMREAAQEAYDRECEGW